MINVVREPSLLPPKPGFTNQPITKMNVPLTYNTLPENSGDMDGTINICHAKDTNMPPESATCESYEEVVSKSQTRNNVNSREPFMYLGMRVRYRSTAGTAEIVHYVPGQSDKYYIADDIDVPIQSIWLRTHHPVFELISREYCEDPQGSPLLLDLNSNNRPDWLDGSSHPVRFDLFANDKPVMLSWMGPGDGLLALDINDNNKIDSGRELFGEHSAQPNGTPGRFKDGFAALAQYDLNKDGVINAKDAIFAKLKVWRDLNSNGKSETSELKSLSDYGITALSLTYEHLDTSLDRFGSSAKLSSTFSDKTGKARKLFDVWFGIRPEQSAP
jgi:hypothetical protein